MYQLVVVQQDDGVVAHPGHGVETAHQGIMATCVELHPFHGICGSVVVRGPALEGHAKEEDRGDASGHEGVMIPTAHLLLPADEGDVGVLEDIEDRSVHELQKRRMLLHLIVVVGAHVAVEGIPAS